jgi:hypothetical protein
LRSSRLPPFLRPRSFSPSAKFQMRRPCFGMVVPSILLGVAMPPATLPPMEPGTAAVVLASRTGTLHQVDRCASRGPTAFPTPPGLPELPGR